MAEMKDKILKKYKELFNDQPIIVKSPGRVNLIGEHTDYNEGFVLPAAIDRAITMAINIRDDDEINLFSIDKDQNYSTKLSTLKNSDMGWPNYIMGVVNEYIKKEFDLKGFNCVFGGNIPIGAGLSSSAALEGAVSVAIKELHDFKIDNIDLVKMGQSAEHNFVGVRCGIMDQFINIFGKSGNVLRIDCRSNEYMHFPFATDEHKIVLCDTGIRRALAGSEYNVRRSQCESGVAILRKYKSNIMSLRDVSHFFLDEHCAEMDEVVYKRCAYVIEENIRVLNGCKDLEQGNLASFGQRMFSSHQGLSEDYEVSCVELDLLVKISSDLPGVLGSRMMGAGFGGCTINLVESEHVASFTEKVKKEYWDKMDTDINIYVSEIEGGVSVVG